MPYQRAIKLIASLLFLTLLSHDVQGLSQTWEITKGFRTPDCVDAAVILVNGEFPGPVVRVQPGEKIAITIKNRIPNSAISVHFHGQNQLGTPYMDGAAMVSSCPTGPHQSFTYKFTANEEPGTFMYHLHTGADRGTGLYGMFIIEERATDPLFNNELVGEHALMLADWYHAPIEQIVTGLLSPAFRWPGDPNSLLVNGKGRFGCNGDDLEEYCDQCSGLETIEVISGGLYRLRFANVAALAYLNVAIENHTMTVIETDGHPVKPVTVTSLDLSSGQRYSVLVNTNQPAGSYRISVQTRHRSNVRSTYAVLKYSTAALSDPGAPTAQQLAALHPAWDDVDFSYAQQEGYSSLPGANPEAPANNDVTKRMVLVGTQERFAAGAQKNRLKPEDNCDSADNTKELRWALGRVTYNTEHDTPVAIAAFQGETDSFTEDRGYIEVQRGDVVDLVMQNYPACNGVCEAHPWHLHGHHFWVVGQGHGEWTGSAEQLASLKTGSDPVYRDTVTLTTDQSSAPLDERKGCGWVVLRFVANNPGAWNFHCHIAWHTIMGMRSVVWYSDGIPEPPADFPCYNPDVQQIVEPEEPEPDFKGAAVHFSASLRLVAMLAMLALSVINLS